MVTPNQLADYRKRAFNHLLKRLDKTNPMLVDYYIDDALRALFDLPDRPNNQPPYVGWMSPPSNVTGSIRFTSQDGIDLIKEFEGFRANAYLCPAGVWTIGFGHTATARPGMTISRNQGEILLKQDLQSFERTVNEQVKVNINQNQFDALVSFTYNVGSHAFANSTLLRLLNQGKYDAAASQLHRWVNGGGKKLPGLVRRRQAEYKLFMSA